MIECIKADSLVTLHYCIASADGEEFVSTFTATPATLQLGNGELAPALERCLLDLPVGERRVFMLEPDQAFGAPVPQLVQRIPRSRLPNGKGDTLQTALIDFNHPLAGKSIRFEVEVIGIL